MRAAVFCINHSLFSRCLGSPYNKELQLSSLKLMNAGSARSRHGFFFRCSVRLRQLSIATPRFRAEVEVELNL